MTIPAEMSFSKQASMQCVDIIPSLTGIFISLAGKNSERSTVLVTPPQVCLCFVVGNLSVWGGGTTKLNRTTFEGQGDTV